MAPMKAREGNCTGSGRSNPRFRFFVWIAAVVAPSVASGADPAPRVAGEELLAAMRSTLDAHPLLGIYQRQVEISRADLAVAQSSFDHLVSLALGRSHDITPVTAGGEDTETTDQTDLSLGVSRTLPWGMTVAPSVALSRASTTYGGSLTSLYGRLPIISNTASVDFGVAQPLLKGLGMKASAGQMRSASYSLKGAEFDARYNQASLVLIVIQRYWALLAAVERLEILNESEDRASQLLKETSVLVAADERPAADLRAIEASLADTRVRVAQAQSAEFEALNRYGAAMGLTGADLTQIKRPSAVLMTGALQVTDESIDLERLLERARAQRADLQAQSERVQGAAALHTAARHNVLPSLDLQLSVGYSGLADGDDASFFDPLRKDVEGFNGALGLTLGLPIENRAARSDLWRQGAQYEVNRIQLAELERQLTVDLTVATRALEASIAQVKGANIGVEAYEAAVRSEGIKLREGISTIIDLVLTQDRLTSARFVQVDARLGQLQVLAQLAFLMGALPSEPGDVSSSLLPLLLDGRWDEQG